MNGGDMGGGDGDGAARGGGQPVAEVLEGPEWVELNAMVESVAGLGVYVWDPRESRVRWSRGMFRLLDLDPATRLEAAAFFGRVHPQDLERVRDAFIRTLAGDDVAPITYRVLRADGSTRWLRGTGTTCRDARGQAVKVVGTLVDVTAAQEALLSLERTTTFLTESQRAAGAGSHIFYLADGRHYWSPELYRMLRVDPNVTPSAALARKLVHPADLERQESWGRAVATGAELPPLMVRLVRPDGAIRHMETRARRIDTPEGPAIIGVSLDVTDRVALEEQLRHASKMEAIGTLSAGLAHDFNNYLTVLDIELQALRRHAPADEAEALDSALEATRQCSSLVTQLLGFSRRRPTAPERVELGRVVAAVARLVERSTREAIQVRVQTSERSRWVVADASQLESAILNLAVNACDAMPEGGLLSFHVEGVQIQGGDPRLALAGGAAPGDWVRVRVVDTGRGVAPEHLPHLFEPYFTTKPAGQGLGLGLATTYGTVRQHGGFLRVRSEPGHGSEFEIYLPAAPDEVGSAAAGAAAAETGATTAASGSVLVVEDMRPLRDVLVELLRQAGHQVISAGDGVEALEKAEGRKLDVLLSDVVMPRMGGVALAAELRARQPGVQVVLMTGYAHPRDLDSVAGETGISGTLRKPFATGDVLAAIERALARRRGGGDGVL